MTPEKNSTAAPYKIHGYTCVCGEYTGITEGEQFDCAGCGRSFKLTVTGGPTPEDRYRKALAELDTWIRLLHNAPRTGADRDEPEGSRTVTISDTLAQNLCDCLRELRDTALKGLHSV